MPEIPPAIEVYPRVASADYQGLRRPPGPRWPDQSLRPYGDGRGCGHHRAGARVGYTTWRVIASRSAIEEHLSYRRTTSAQEQSPCCRLSGSPRASAEAWRNTVISFVGRQGSTMSVAMSPA